MSRSGLALHQLTASCSADSMWRCFCQSRSKCGDCAGMRMYSVIAGTIASSQNWPMDFKALLRRRDVSRSGVGAFAEEMALGLFHEVLARFRVGEVEAVLVHQHGLLLQPLRPGFLGDAVPDAFAERSRVGREVHAFGFASQLYALHHSRHARDYMRLRKTFDPRRQL